MSRHHFFSFNIKLIKKNLLVTLRLLITLTNFINKFSARKINSRHSNCSRLHSLNLVSILQPIIQKVLLLIVESWSKHKLTDVMVRSWYRLFKRVHKHILKKNVQRILQRFLGKASF